MNTVWSRKGSLSKLRLAYPHTSDHETPSSSTSREVGISIVKDEPMFSEVYSRTKLESKVKIEQSTAKSNEIVVLTSWSPEAVDVVRVYYQVPIFEAIFIKVPAKTNTG
jgi:hypothetical protein